ncbi:Dolichol kinase sec59 [Auxenochlorella protothecoides]|uniref:dolichol kinase n=1 Tax=Auxenochlorella protothecoides TaxID=3075 RepID=A0A087SE96_AUXPR|nr:Dolichol kinase sec59 [Auxenochlorella protothecoides]KFM24050.1 Dolichol kinase sec59 [Auxenochlorella protothecoides]
MMKSQYLELFINAVTIVIVLHSLFQHPHAAIIYQGRDATGPGLALGLLAVPLLTAATAASRPGEGLVTHGAFQAALALASGQLLLIATQVALDQRLSAWDSWHARDEADGEELGTPSKARAHCSLLAQGTVAAAPPPEPWRAQGSAAAVLGSLGVLGTLLVIAVLSGDPAVLPWAYAALGAGTLHATLALLLPRTLTLGEGALITQGLVLAVTAASTATPPLLRLVTRLPVAAVAAGCALIPLLKTARVPWQRVCLGCSCLLTAGLALAAIHPALWALQYGLATPRRRAVLLAWFVLLGGGLPAMRWLSSRKTVPQILVTLFLPVLLVEPGLLGLALAIAFAGLVAVEAVRSAALPGVSLRITDFMERFTDARDAGPIYVTHFALLLGMALPVWLSLDWEAGERQGPPGLLEGGAVRARAPALAGILILGFGDSAASLVGRLWGDHALAADNPKTWEGLAAGSAATLAGWVGVALLSSALPGVALLSPQPTQGGLLAATSLSCFLEAVTGQLDNAVLPLHYYTLLLCLA